RVSAGLICALRAEVRCHRSDFGRGRRGRGSGHRHPTHRPLRLQTEWRCHQHRNCREFHDPEHCHRLAAGELRTNYGMNWRTDYRADHRVDYRTPRMAASRSCLSPTPVYATLPFLSMITTKEVAATSYASVALPLSS